MAVYKIYPEKDATIYTEKNTLNSGLDPILELSKDDSILYPSYSAVARSVIKFSDDDINQAISSYVGNKPFKSFLRVYLADASEIPLEYTLKAFAISGSWDMGTGRAANIPVTTDGVSWTYRKADGTYPWSSSLSIGVTSSFYSSNPGGGNWYYSTGTSQSFNHHSDKDIYMDVSGIINSIVSGSIVNDGIILKNSDDIEFDPNYKYKLTYFSRDTNTIHSPCLELKWDDSVFYPNTGSKSIATTSDLVISVGNNPGEFKNTDVYKFKVNCREKHPIRTFTTSSVYAVGKYMPQTSYYSVVDMDTDNVIIDFDDNYTKISADGEGSYFFLYMNGLQPERYYKLQIKTVVSGSQTIFDDSYYFKIRK